MNIKNYTSGVPAEKSISKIEKILVELGANHINKHYESGKITAISFLIMVNGRTIPFRLPAKVDMIEKVLLKGIKKPRKGTYDKIYEQSERTAWKLICDWVEIQASMINMEQAEIIEVFLPYVYDLSSDTTFYQSIKQGGFKQLSSGT